MVNRKVDLVLEEKHFRALLHQCIRGHQFGHDGADPKTVIVPKIDVVDGVKILYVEPDNEDV